MPNASPHLLKSLVIRDHHLMTGGKMKLHNDSNKSNIKQDSGDEEESSVKSSANVGRSIQKKGFRKRRNR